MTMRSGATSLLAAAMAVLLAFPAQLRATAYDGHPKLIVVIVIDQFRGDLLERYRDSFKGNGFRLFLDKGADFPDCYYDYANTFTAPGHATLATGAYTDGHGISANQWWDLRRNTKRPVTSVEDDRYTVVGGDAAQAPSASPRNLTASTLGDELRLATGGESKVYAVSLKDRAAILSGGAAANGAFWIEEKSGKFLTSSYYMSAMPDWAQQFNASDAASKAEQAAGVTTVTNFNEEVGQTNAGNDYEIAFAEALIQGELLGHHNAPDLLVISLSPNDTMGHKFGPDSPQARDMALGIDGSLDSFFAFLDKQVEGGLGNVWLALSADHGVAPTVATARELGLPAALIPVQKLTDALNAGVNGKFSPGEKVAYILPKQTLPYLSLNRPAFEKAGINEQEAEDAVMAALPAAVASLSDGQVSAQPPAAPVPDATAPAQSGDAAPDQTAATSAAAPAAAVSAPPKRWPAPPALAHAYTRLEIAKGEYPTSEYGSILGHSYSANGGWWVMLEPAAFQMEGSSADGTTHDSAYSYDRHVPLAFYGAPFTHGTYRGRVQPVDLAATFASLLGINQPSASVGRVLNQALRVPQYPSVAKAPVRHGRGSAAAPATTPATEAPAK